MELTTVNKTFELPVAISNFEELRQAITPKINFYKSLVVTEDTVKSAKSDRADLNRLRKAIDDERKKIKACYLMPYQAIEDEFRQLIDLIDEPIKAIDGQLKSIDEQALQVKKQALEEHFHNENPPDFLRLDDVLPVRWKNKSEKTESLKAEISARISDLRKNYELLILNCKLYERYETLCKPSVSDSGAGNVTPLPVSTDNVTGSVGGSQTVSGTYRVTCSAEQLGSLRDFMRQTGINFEVIREDNRNGK